MTIEGRIYMPLAFKGIRKASEAFNVKKATLHDHVKGKQNKK